MQEGPKIDACDFEFKELARPRLIPKLNGTVNTCQRVCLLAASNKYGLLFMANDTGVSVYTSGSFHNVQGETAPPPPPPLQHINTGVQPSWIAVNADHTVLSAVVLKPTAGHFALLFDIRCLANKKKPVVAFSEIRLTSQDSITVVDLAWNPGEPYAHQVAVCSSDGAVSLYETSPTGTSYSLRGQLTTIEATCLCWSPKGKQIVIGKKDGSFSQFDQILQPKRHLSAIQSDKKYSAVDILWESTHAFIILLAGQDKAVNLCSVSAPKGGKPVYTEHYEPCFHSLNNANHYYMKSIAEWNMVICASANSGETCVLGKSKVNPTNWEVWDLPELAVTQMPVDQTVTETSPMGMVVDFTPTNLLQKDNETKYKLSPVLVLMSSDGTLLSYSMVYSEPNAPSLNTNTSELSVENSRVPSFLIALPVPTAQPVQPQQLPAPAQPTAKTPAFGTQPQGGGGGGGLAGLLGNAPSNLASTPTTGNFGSAIPASSTPNSSLFKATPPFGATPTVATSSSAVNPAFGSGKPSTPAPAGPRSSLDPGAPAQTTPTFGSTRQLPASSNHAPAAPAFSFGTTAPTPISVAPTPAATPAATAAVPTGAATPTGVAPASKAGTTTASTGQFAPLARQLQYENPMATSTPMVAKTTAVPTALNPTGKPGDRPPPVAGAVVANRTPDTPTSVTTVDPKKSSQTQQPKERAKLTPDEKAYYKEKINQEIGQFGNELKALKKSLHTISTKVLNDHANDNQIHDSTSKLLEFSKEITSDVHKIASSIEALRYDISDSLVTIDRAIQTDQSQDTTVNGTTQFTHQTDPKLRRSLQKFQFSADNIGDVLSQMNEKLDSEWYVYIQSKSKGNPAKLHDRNIHAMLAANEKTISIHRNKLRAISEKHRGFMLNKAGLNSPKAINSPTTHSPTQELSSTISCFQLTDNTRNIDNALYADAHRLSEQQSQQLIKLFNSRKVNHVVQPKATLLSNSPIRITKNVSAKTNNITKLTTCKISSSQPTLNSDNQSMITKPDPFKSLTQLSQAKSTGNSAAPASPLARGDISFNSASRTPTGLGAGAGVTTANGGGGGALFASSTNKPAPSPASFASNVPSSAPEKCRSQGFNGLGAASSAASPSAAAPSSALPNTQSTPNGPPSQARPFSTSTPVSTSKTTKPSLLGSLLDQTAGGNSNQSNMFTAGAPPTSTTTSTPSSNTMFGVPSKSGADALASSISGFSFGKTSETKTSVAGSDSKNSEIFGDKLGLGGKPINETKNVFGLSKTATTNNNKPVFAGFGSPSTVSPFAATSAAKPIAATTACTPATSTNPASSAKTTTTTSTTNGAAGKDGQSKISSSSSPAVKTPTPTTSDVQPNAFASTTTTTTTTSSGLPSTATPTSTSAGGTSSSGIATASKGLFAGGDTSSSQAKPIFGASLSGSVAPNNANIPTTTAATPATTATTNVGPSTQASIFSSPASTSASIFGGSSSGVFGAVSSNVGKPASATVFGGSTTSAAPTPSSVFGGSTGTGAPTPSTMFGVPTTSAAPTPSSVFGGSNNSAGPTPSSVFGGSSNGAVPTPSSVFGGGNNAAKPSMFGASPAVPKTSMFGTGNNGDKTSSAFGASGANSTTATTSSTSIFGASATTASSPSMFSSKPDAVAPSSFASPSSSSTSAHTFGSSTFGVSTTVPPPSSQTTSSIFGAGSSAPSFGSTTFGSASSSAASPFGVATPSSSSTTTASIFGAASSTPSMFGSSGSTPAPSAFGATTPAAAPSQSVFGGGAGSTPSVFGGAAPASSVFGAATSTPTFGSSPATNPSFGGGATFGSSPGLSAGSPSVFGASTQGSAFGKSSAEAPTFGSMMSGQSSSFACQPQSSIFGGQASTAGGTTFGAQSSTPIFGGTSNASSTGFGADSQC